MGHRYTEIAFTDAVRELQSKRGSREQYRRFEQGEDHHHLLTVRESEFILHPIGRCHETRKTRLDDAR